MFKQNSYLILFSIVTILLAISACSSDGSEPPKTSPAEDQTAPETQAEAEEVDTGTENVKPVAEDAQVQPNVESAQLTMMESELLSQDEIVVQFEVVGTVLDDAWIGILPSDIPHTDETEADEHDITYQYLAGETSGEMVFVAPDIPGNYDLRMYDTDNGGQEIASVSFTVAGSDAEKTETDTENVEPVTEEAQVQPNVESAQLTMMESELLPQDEIIVQFEVVGTVLDDAWIGILPSDVPHTDEAEADEHDITYQYLAGESSGEMVFVAPDIPGNYDLRMYDTDNGGQEIASVSFTVASSDGFVSDEGVSITLSKTTFAPGEEIIAEFVALDSYASNAWIGIIPADITHGDESLNDQHDIDYQYLEGQLNGSFTFTAPETPGSYDLRMHDSDNEGREVVYVTFQVE